MKENDILVNFVANNLPRKAILEITSRQFMVMLAKLMNMMFVIFGHQTAVTSWHKLTQNIKDLDLIAMNIRIKPL